MEKITISSNISFCFGVQNTITLINEILQEKKYKNIYMLGEVVHNEHVINDFKRKGLKLIREFHEIPSIKDGILIIQSHGLSKKIYEYLKKRKIPFIDSTCKLVGYIHNSAQKLEKEGYFPVIIGERNHTEVQGIAGHVKRSIIINDETEITDELFKGIKKAGVVFQSTFIEEKGKQILRKLKQKVKNIKVIDTICRPTKNRQRELKENVKKYRSVLIIGSKTSANTNHLYQIARLYNKNTFLVNQPEDAAGLPLKKLFPCFITSGASTPITIIEDTIKNIGQLTNKFHLFSHKYVPLIDRAIKEFFQNNKIKNDINIKEINFLEQELRKYCLRPGKRIRPLLLILSYIGFSGHSTFSQLGLVLNISVILELMHSFLLIHDDIIDKAEMRRGQKSLHVIAGEKYRDQTVNPSIGADIALVLGDILFTRALALLSKIPLSIKIKNEFLSVFSRCYELTGWGQILDSLYSLPKKLSSDSKISYSIYKLKTAYYTVFYPILMGYILSGKMDKKTIEKIRNFTLPLGVAFQIRDDLTGLFGDKLKTGKSDVSDIIDGKSLILINMTNNLLKGKDKQDFNRLFLKEKKTEDDINKIKGLIRRSGAIEKNTEEMKRLLSRALKNLNNININNPEKEILKDLTLLLQEA